MHDIFFVILFFTFPFIVLKYMHKLGLNIFIISIPTSLITFIFIFAYIGVFPLYFGWDEYRANLGIVDKEILFKIFMFNSITIVGILIGFSFSKNILKLDFPQRIGKILEIEKNDLIFMIIILIVCIIVFCLYLSKINEIALFTIIRDDYNGLGINKFDIVRSNMTNAFPGKYHWYSLFMHNILIVVTFSFFICFLKQKWKGTLFLFIISFLLSSFISIMATEKSPLFWLLIGFFLVYIMVKYNSKIPIKKFIFFSSTIIIGLTFMYYYMFMHSVNKTIFDAISAVFSRTFTGSIQPAYHYLEFFPIHHDFLYGRSFPNPKGIFPFETFILTQEIMNFAQPEHLTSGIVGTMPTIFWAEAYANFGLIGVFVIPFLAGVIIWAFSYFVSKFENRPIKIALYVWLILHFKNLSVTGFSDFIIDFYLIFTIGIFVIYIKIIKLFKVNKF